MKHGKKDCHFTLIELLAVIGIIAVLAAITIGVTQVASRKASEAKAKAQLQMLENALQQYREDYGYYPQFTGTISEDLLENQFEDPDTGRNYLQARQFETSGDDVVDPFGSPYQYKCPGSQNPRSYDLWSHGDDQTNDTEDDITNWGRN